MSYTYHTEDEVRYNLSCPCSCCSTQTFITLGRSAYAPQDFIRLAKRYRLTEAQQKVVDEMKLKVWNNSVKGESA
jgi:hypothetical protein